MAWAVHTEPVTAAGALGVGPSGAAEYLPKPTVLVVGTDDWAIEQSAVVLEAGGCEVLRCHEPGEPAFPCNALIEGRTCPLDVGFDLVADVRALPLSNLAQSEFGVICALHHGKPLVVAGVAPDLPLGPWAALKVGQGGDLVSACERVAAGETEDDTAEPPARLLRRATDVS